jgi:glyceraldehyde 3-phosphate dehydrogenase (phosphorylating)
LTPAALNGLGRFGQHLLYAWLADPGALSIDYACDESLDAQTVCSLLVNHDRLDFSWTAPSAEGDFLLLTRADGVRQRIAFYCGPAQSIPWLGEPVLWLECSGRHTSAAEAGRFCQGKTRQVLVSATSRDADQTVVMGLNETEYLPAAKVVSYGSCTVNAFAPLAQVLHTRFGVTEAEVHVVHNVPAHRLLDMPHPRRHQCTLQEMAPRLLPWLAPDRFYVAYTLIPYTGASLITFRFRMAAPVVLENIYAALCGPESTLADRYCFPARDAGLQSAVGMPFNVVIPRNGIELVGDNLVMSGYFDNENSAVRYLELAQLATLGSKRNPGMQE